MEMEHWCEFAVLAERKNYSRTAEVMNISQSSLSKHIMALEKDLGVKLLDRTSRHVELSEDGLRFLPLAREIQEQYGRLRQMASQQQRLSQTTLTIVSIPVMAQYGITETIAEFRKLYPEVVMNITECESVDIPQHFRAGFCELAFTRDPESDPPEDPELESIPYCSDRMVAVLPYDHELARNDFIFLEQLKGEDFLLMDDSTSLHRLSVALCKRAGYEPKVIYTGHRPENIVGLVASGMGISLLMRGHTEYVDNPDVAAVPVRPIVESTICLSRQKGKKLSKYAALFWEFIQQKGQENKV